MKKRIVMFWFMNDWGKFGRTYQKIAEQLSTRPDVARVVCILPPKWSRSPVFLFSLFTRKLIVLNQSSCIESGRDAPSRFDKLCDGLLRKVAFRMMLTALGFRRHNTILWLFPPHAQIGKLKESVPHGKCIVQIVDNNSALEKFTKAQREALLVQYQGLCESADDVIVSSEANRELFSQWNQNLHLFENAVDSAFLGPPSKLPSQVTPSRPRIGYVGWISERTDLELLFRLAVERPGYDVVLAGPTEVSLDRLVAQSNVEWLGRLDYADLPRFMRSLDVCLIPHKDTAYSRSMSPLKLFQYLATGRPVVCTEIAGARRWQEHLSIAGSHEDFIVAVDSALQSETLEKAAARIEAAGKETWDSRISDMMQVLFPDDDKFL